MVRCGSHRDSIFFIRSASFYSLCSAPTVGKFGQSMLRFNDTEQPRCLCVCISIICISDHRHSSSVRFQQQQFHRTVPLGPHRAASAGRAQRSTGLPVAKHTVSRHGPFSAAVKTTPVGTTQRSISSCHTKQQSSIRIRSHLA